LGSVIERGRDILILGKYIDFLVKYIFSVSGRQRSLVSLSRVKAMYTRNEISYFQKQYVDFIFCGSGEQNVSVPLG